MRVLPTLLLTLAFVLFALPAMAQSEADKTAARDLTVAAQKHLEAKQFAEAAEKFRKADQLYQAPTIVLGLARAYRGMGKFVEAMETYNRVIREKLPTNASDALVKAVEDAKQEVVGIKGKIGWVTVTVTGHDDPKVTMDDQPLKNAALGVRRPMNPGEHVVKASATGFTPSEKIFTITAIASVTIELTLAPRPDTPIGEETQPVETEVSTGSPMRTIGFVALGVGAAGLIAGAITGGLAVGKHSQLEENCTAGQCPATQQSTLDDYERMGAISTVGFIAGGVLAAAGAVLIISAPSAPSEEPATVSLAVRPTSASLRIRF